MLAAHFLFSLNQGTNFMSWVVLTIVVGVALVIDLGVFHRDAHVMRVREAILWSAIWIGIALAFNAGVYYFRGVQDGNLFLTGYLVEKALSVDNLFVFLAIFSYFAVPGKYQRAILFWGIIGAMVTRGVLIACGVALIHRFFWLTYVLGVFLIFTGLKTAFGDHNRFEPEKNPLILFLRKILPVTNYFAEGKFFVRESGKLFVTPLFVTLIVVEITDVLFALDSVPAILAITTDPFLVYSSNLFAILGLRALFFALAGLLGLFRYLQQGVSLILVLVGAKMLGDQFLHVPESVMLLSIVAILTVSVLASIWRGPKDQLSNLNDDPIEKETGDSLQS